MTTNYRTIQTLGNIFNTIELIQNKCDSEFTRKQYDTIRPKHSTTLDYLKECGITNGRFRTWSPWDKKEDWHPLLKVVREEPITIKIKNPIEIAIFKDENGNLIENVNQKLIFNADYRNLFDEKYPNWTKEYKMTNDLEVVRKYYALDTDVVQCLKDLAMCQKSDAIKYAQNKINEAQNTIDRYSKLLTNISNWD